MKYVTRMQKNYQIINLLQFYPNFEGGIFSRKRKYLMPKSDFIRIFAARKEMKGLKRVQTGLTENRPL